MALVSMFYLFYVFQQVLYSVLCHGLFISTSCGLFVTVRTSFLFCHLFLQLSNRHRGVEEGCAITRAVPVVQLSVQLISARSTRIVCAVAGCSIHVMVPNHLCVHFGRVPLAWSLCRHLLRTLHLGEGGWGFRSHDPSLSF